MHVTLTVDALGPKMSGIGRYTWEMCRHLRGQAGIEGLSYFRSGRWFPDPSVLLDPEHKAKKTSAPQMLVNWANKRRLANSLVHGTNFFLPPEAESGIVTVHDLSVFRYPDFHPEARRKHFERSFVHTLARARHIITLTETVRQEIISDLNVAPSQVTAIHLGVDEKFRSMPADTLAEVLGRYGLQANSYGLCVSAIEPRKRIGQLIDAWARLPAALRKATPLVLTSADGWLNDLFRMKMERAISEGWLIFLDFVPEGDLPAIYAGAKLFIYPSLYEGFGLPPIEAMACGVPVLVANCSCFPEVCGDAARYVEPDDLEGFALSIEEALMDHEWQKLCAAIGPLHASKYQWASCAAETLNVYKSLF